jgi:putative flippase GtrA
MNSHKPFHQHLHSRASAAVQRLLDYELLRYGASGVVAFVGDFAVLVLLTELFDIHYLISNIAGYAVGLVVSYLLNINFVFKHRVFGDRQGQEFTYFVAIVLAGLAISEAAMYLMTEGVEINYMWAKVISVFFVFLFNYVAKKFLLFHAPS